MNAWVMLTPKSRLGVYIGRMIDGAGRLTDRLHRRTRVRSAGLRTEPGTGLTTAGLFLLYLVVVGCSERTRATRVGTATAAASSASGDGWWRSGGPDELPQMLNSDAPFRYPVTSFRRRQQGNVMLRLYVDASGTVISDSTTVDKPSGEPLLDSAALAGSSLLRFRPARRRGVPIAVVMLFPVHFRLPGEPRLTGDSL